MDEMLNDATCTIEKANERALAIMQERYKPTDPPKCKVTEDEADEKTCGYRRRPVPETWRRIGETCSGCG